MTENKNQKYHYWISIFLNFISPFAIWNFIFSIFPEILNWNKALLEFYKIEMFNVIFAFIIILIFTSIFILEDKKRVIIKILWKHHQNREFQNVFWTYFVLKTLFFVPFLSILSEIYYQNKKMKLNSRLISYKQEIILEYSKILDSYKWFLFTFAFLIPIGFFLSLDLNGSVTIKIMSILFFISLVFAYIFLETRILKRAQIFKSVASNKEIAKMYLVWKLLHFLLIIPILGLLPEIYFQIKKKKIESFIQP